MLVILIRSQERDIWPTAPAPVALELRRPLGNEALIVVARGGKHDGAQAL